MTDPAIHVREDTAKPENRTNLAFFSILMIDEMHDFVCESLGLHKDVVICPCPNLVSGEFVNITPSVDALKANGAFAFGRPDFKVVRTLGDPKGSELAYIEVELGPQDDAQVCRYRAFGKHVYSIVGKRDMVGPGSGDISLQDIADKARVLIDNGQRQRDASLRLFVDLVEYYIDKGMFRPSLHRQDVSEKVMNSPLIQALATCLGASTFCVGKSQRGKLLLNTIKENGFSLRIYTHGSINGISLLCQTAGRPTIYFPTYAKLARMFPYRSSAVEAFVDCVARTLGAGSDARLGGERQRIGVAYETVMANIAPLCKVIEQMMEKGSVDA